MREHVAEGYLHHTMGGDFDLGQFLGQLSLVNGALSDPAWDVPHVLVDGDMAAVYVRFEGTHSGPFFGIPATGRRVSTVGACFMRIADGRIVEDWDSWALQSILRQIS